LGDSTFESSVAPAAAAHRTDAISQLPFTWPSTLRHRLQVLGASQGVPLSLILLAGFETLLHRYTDQDEFTIRCVIPAGIHSDPSADAVPLRVDFRGSPSFRDVITRVRNGLLESRPEAARNEADDRLRSDHMLAPARFLGATFATTPAFVPTSVQHPAWCQSDLCVAVWPDSDALAGSCAYRANVFDEQSIKRLIGHLETLLDGGARSPDEDVSLLPILSDVEKHSVLVEWNNSDCSYSETACIHELFEAQVERSPHGIAAVFEDLEVTYRELNAWANQLARYLRELGARPDSLIGLHVSGPLEQIVGLLAILKAGAAYVPLDPAFPKGRLKAMLHDAAVSLLVTQKHLLADIPVEAWQRVVCLDGDWREQRGLSSHNLARVATPDSLAYVLYTSGSTGTPKGIPITHRSVVNFLESMQRELRLTPNDRVQAITTVNFDMAVLEIYLPLISGASVCVVDRDTAIDGAAMAERASHPRITLMQATPAMWQLLLEAGWSGNARLKAISGGEAMVPSLAAELLSRCAAVWNMYGPTETTVYASTHKINGAGAEPVPIGRPIGNVQLYVLDSHLQPRPVGIPGEIYIGGLGVAKGYLNRPELTAQAFIPDIFRPNADGGLYKTGDYGCYRGDGTIEYLGRIDRQVKIHGFRIELDEVENALCQHPDVLHAVVLAREDFSGARRLVAYVVPKPATQPTATDVLEYLQATLPHYMVPSACVFLKTLPLTPNGKVDRRALPSPESTCSPIDEGYVAPKNDAERRLAVAWETVLGRQPIGTRDNFFYHGGDSLLAVRLVLEIEKTWGKQLPLGALYQAPTIEQLANKLDRAAASTSLLIPIQPAGSRPPLFWFHGEHSNVVLPQYLGKEQPLYGILHQGHDGRPARYTTVEAMGDHYLAEIRRIQPRGPYCLGGYCFGAILALETAQRLQKDGDVVDLVALLDPDNFTNLPTHMEQLPRPGPVGGLRESFRDRIRRHVATLKRLRAGEIVAYCRVRLQNRLSHGARTVAAMVRTACCNVCFALRRPLPARLHSHYMLRIYAAAMARYMPERYSGRLLVWKTTDNACDTSILKNLSEQVEIREIDGSHVQILKEPHLRTWAERLAQELRRLGSRTANCGVGFVALFSDWGECVYSSIF
jgi:amino acid adenylation domain-containing protein